MILAQIRRWLGVAGLVVLIVASGLVKADVEGAWPGVLAASGAGLAALGLLWNWRSVLSFLLRRSVLSGAGTAVYSVVVLGLVVLANFLAARHAWRWDLTESGSFSLSPRTRQILRSLDREVRIVAMFPDESRRGARTARATLDVFRHEGSRVRVDYIDPVKRPDVPARYGIQTKGKGTVVVETGDRWVLAQNPSEEAVATAILGLTRPTRKKVCFLTGHGERRLDDPSDAGFSGAAAGLEKLLYENRPLSLATEAEVPADCDVVLSAAPLSPFQPEEVRALEAYLARDGHLMILAEPRSRASDGGALAPLFDRWGVAYQTAVIVDRGAARGQVFSPVISDFDKDLPVTKPFQGREIQLFGACPVVWYEANPRDPLIYHAALAWAGQNAWADTDVAALAEGRQPFYDSATDTLRPAVAACAYRRSWEDVHAPAAVREEKREGRFLVVGDCDFAANANLENRFNREWFEALVGWLSREEALASAPAGREGEDQFVFQRSGFRQRDLYQLVYVCVAPAVLIVALGLFIMARRRNL